MRQVFITLLVFTAILFLSPAGMAAEPVTATCGGYSYTLPDGYSARDYTVNPASFPQDLFVNEPFVYKDLSRATVMCLQEKKTAHQGYLLLEKRKIGFRTAQRMSMPLQITAMEDLRQNNLQFRFLLLEETINTAPRREVRGKHLYIPAIEVGSRNDKYHTVLFIYDGRETRSFFNMDEYKAAVTEAAVFVLDSITPSK